MNDRADSNPPGGSSSGLEFDPEAVLLREPSMLLHSTFLAALHSELDDELGGQAARTTLLQIGFLHGLQDASRLVGDAFGAGRAESAAAMAPPLAIRLDSRPTAAASGAIELEGSWPERCEAAARLSALGPCEHAACYLSAGYTSGWFSGIFEIDLLAVETACCAGGSGSCRFHALEAAAWRQSGDPEALALLDALPFEAFRQFVEERRAPEMRPPTGASETEGSIVHVWGPVMVVPFIGPEEALRAVELIGTDAAAADVSVVVVDLSDASVDETYGALALERIVETAESWGAETLFAEVSPISEPVIAGLERQPLMVHKDLNQAIAAAFQIARSQRALS